MYRLVRFFKRYYAVFLFVLLEAGAISYYANSTSYTRATLLAGAARVTGGIEGFFASAGDYFRCGAKTPCCSNASPKPRPDYMPPYPQAIHWPPGRTE